MEDIVEEIKREEKKKAMSLRGGYVGHAALSTQSGKGILRRSSPRNYEKKTVKIPKLNV